MADEHRRVEPRGVVGSGMLTDPERIEQLAHDRERLERTWREAPKRKFGEVLSEAPARPSPGDGEEPRDANARDRQRRDGEASDDEAAASAPSPVDAGDEKPLPRVPPDPRMARLHAMLTAAPPPRGPGRKGP